MLSMTPKKGRKYPTSQKTTTRQGKREYSKYAMRDYRKRRAEDLEKMKKELERLRKAIHGTRGEKK